MTKARPITRCEGTPSTLHRLPGSRPECYEAWPFQAVPSPQEFQPDFPGDRISITYKPSLVCLFFTHTNSTPCHRQFAYLWATQDRPRQSGTHRPPPPATTLWYTAARLNSLSSPEKDQPILDANQGPSATARSKLPGLQLPYDRSDVLIGDSLACH